MGAEVKDWIEIRVVDEDLKETVTRVLPYGVEVDTTKDQSFEVRVPIETKQAQKARMMSSWAHKVAGL